MQNRWIPLTIALGFVFFLPSCKEVHGTPRFDKDNPLESSIAMLHTLSPEQRKQFDDACYTLAKRCMERGAALEELPSMRAELMHGKTAEEIVELSQEP